MLDLQFLPEDLSRNQLTLKEILHAVRIGFRRWGEGGVIFACGSAIACKNFIFACVHVKSVNTILVKK